MEPVTGASSGRYVVTTESGSRYLLDMDQHTASRTPETESDEDRRLRRDHETVNLVEVIRCEVGKPMLLLLDFELPHVLLTARVSTPVTQIAPVQS